MKPAGLIPPLAFGNHKARTDFSTEALEERTSAVLGWGAAFRFMGPRQDFITRSASVRFHDLSLSSVSYPELETKVTCERTLSLFVPVAGSRCNTLVNGMSIDAAPGEQAFFAPAGQRLGYGGNRSLLIADFDRSRLLDTAATMAGVDALSQARLQLDVPQTLPLRAGNMDLCAAFIHLSGMVDTADLNPLRLTDLGLDENIYRLIAMLFSYQHSPYSAQSGRAHSYASTRQLSRVCEHVMANLDQRITLTDLERISGLTARSLQYAFRKHYGKTPMEWIRDERYVAARRLLQATASSYSVTEIAGKFLFPSLSQFAAGYKQRYGELPSETKTRARRN
jgi:AraC-like DNA-binding protein